jgi:hypothetical protein
MSKMDSVVHFEMPYDDRERMAKFYRDAFGWQTRNAWGGVRSSCLLRLTHPSALRSHKKLAGFLVRLASGLVDHRGDWGP